MSRKHVCRSISRLETLESRTLFSGTPVAMQLASVTALAVDDGRYLYAVGESLRKLKADGGLIWQREISGLDVVTDGAGNVFVLNSNSLSKLDSQGNLLWQRELGAGGTMTATALDVDASGAAYITGRFDGTVDFDPNGGVFELTAQGIVRGALTNVPNIFVSSLDSSGNFQWANRYDYVQGIGTEIAVDNAGSVWFGGTAQNVSPYLAVIGKLNSTGEKLWSNWTTTTANWYSGLITGLTPDGSGGVYTVEDTWNPPGVEGISISHLNASGGTIWTQQITGIPDAPMQGSVSATAIERDARGYLYLTGTFRGMVDFDTSDQTSVGISAGGNDVYLLKLSSTGQFQQVNDGGGTGDDGVAAMALGSNDRLYLAGSFQGSVTFELGRKDLTFTSTADDPDHLLIFRGLPRR